MPGTITRREFVTKTALATAALSTLGTLSSCSSEKSQPSMKFGLVTYLWGKDWDLPTLIANCETAGFAGVELRTQHKHGVEPSLSAEQRKEVKKRFEDSPVECVGYGSNQEFHSPDPEELKKNIEGSYELIKLCHDIGASGLKVKPNNLPDEIDPKITIRQIGESLNKIGKFAQDYGQKIRVEVHGRKTAQPSVMKAIFEYVSEPNVGMCWNCNKIDLDPPGFEANFNMVKDRFGDTVHIRELNDKSYPYQQLFNLFVKNNYHGWILLEARTKPQDRVAAMQEQMALFNKMLANAQKTV